MIEQMSASGFSDVNFGSSLYSAHRSFMFAEYFSNLSPERSAAADTDGAIPIVSIY